MKCFPWGLVLVLAFEGCRPQGKDDKDILLLDGSIHISHSYFCYYLAFPLAIERFNVTLNIVPCFITSSLQYTLAKERG